MFWKYNVTTTSNVLMLLEKEDVALKELMDEEDILQECKAQQQKLVDFLVRPDVLDELITLMTTEPDEAVDEKTRYKYSNIACEILSFDILPIYEAVTINERLLDKLYNFLKSEKPLNPLLTSFFSKTVGKLLSSKTYTMLEYFKSKPDFIALLLKHIETSAIMDLLTKLMTFTENNQMRADMIAWMNKQDVVNKLISLIDPEFNEDINYNASQILCDTIKASREQMSLMQEEAEPDPLLEAIESAATVQNLLDHMFNGEKRDSVIVSGISVLLALLEFKKHGMGNAQQIMHPIHNNSILQTESAHTAMSSFLFRNEGPQQMTALDAERLAKGTKGVLTAVTPRLSDFHKLLVQPPPRSPMKLTYGILDPPLGYSRLEGVHLLASLIGANNHAVNVELTRLRAIPVMMDLFFEYTWNNFLHTHVEHAIGRIFSNEPIVDEGGNKVHPLLDQFLLEYKITEKLLNSFQADKKENNLGEMVKNGFMGHLSKIANHIAQGADNGSNSDMVQGKLMSLPEEHQKEWKEFTCGKLAEINKKNSTPLAGGLPSSDEAMGFRNVAFPQDSSLAQGQQISSNFVDGFCFDEDCSGFPVSGIAGQLNRLANTQFRLNDDNWVQRNVELFEQVCQEKNSEIPDASEDPDSDEDVWDEKLTYGEERKESGDNSSDSD